MAGFVIGVKDGAVHAAADLNPLAEGIVEGRLGRSAVGQALEAPGVVVGSGDGGIAGGVAGGVIAVGAGEGAGDVGNPRP